MWKINGNIVLLIIFYPFLIGARRAVEPTFDSAVQNITVKAGHTIILPCRIENRGTKYAIIWKSPDNIILTMDYQPQTDEPRYSIIGEENEWNLQITNVLWEDRGSYQCQINTKPIRYKTVNVNVQVPAAIVDEFSSNDATVDEGETVVLYCNVTGVPRPEVTWYKKPFRGLDIDRQKLDKTGEMLVIKNVSRYCDDIYSCVAENGVSSAVSRQMRVTVEYPPEVTLPSSRMRQILGKATMFECKVNAFPVGETSWRKFGEKIRIKEEDSGFSTDAYEIGGNTWVVTLTITKVRQTDYGKYECYSSNPLGSDSETLEFFPYSVEPKPTKISVEYNDKEKHKLKKSTGYKHDKNSSNKELPIRRRARNGSGDSKSNMTSLHLTLLALTLTITFISLIC
ncbi:DgyrCDS13402 [Dimorphilus gyrociliatus]|uniref:DgyrCDS13402 n=1 Tax=Dimorphilus gyrociliatus TaxID=2664684 RepID=A0A7I8WAK3_9ANNE|nr:DgyrCDS13402 [Dimorphilus gyrociliatus]